MYQERERIFTLSNFLSILRVLLVIPFIYFFSSGDKLIAFILVLIAISTDWFDGRVARWTNTISDMGKILDPLADKLCAALLGIYFAYIGELPVWFRRVSLPARCHHLCRWNLPQTAQAYSYHFSACWQMGGRILSHALHYDCLSLPSRS
jgi:hypothetical protein